MKRIFNTDKDKNKNKDNNNDNTSNTKLRNLNKKYIFLVLAIILLLITLVIVQVTYAQYITSLRTTSNIELGSWLIKINDQDIMQDSDFSGSIAPLFDGSLIVNKETVPGLSTPDTIVPSSIGTITLTIDYSSVTTPFSYNITIPSTNLNLLDDLAVLKYTIDETEYNYNIAKDSSITNIVTPDGITTSQEVVLYLTWNDDNKTQTMDDIADTNFSKNASISCDMSIIFEQYIP